MVKNVPSSAGDAAPTLGQAYLLDEGMATYSRTLAWEIPRTEEPGGLQSAGCNELETAEAVQLAHTNGDEVLSHPPNMVPGTCPFLCGFSV